MKFLTVLSLVFVFVIHLTKQELSKDQLEKITKYRTECVADTGVDPILIDRANAGDFVEDRQLMCFAKCFYQKVGFVDQEGNLVLDAIKAKIPKGNKEEALQVIEHCKERKGKDSCETIYLIHKCYFQSTTGHLREEKD